MPAKPRPRPQKVLRSEIFPVCPFTDPLSNENDPEIELRGFAYLSDGSTVIDTLLDCRFDDDSPHLSSHITSTGSLKNKAVVISHDHDQGLLITTNGTIPPNTHGIVDFHEHACKDDSSSRLAVAQTTQNCLNLSVAHDVRIVSDQSEVGSSAEFAEQSHGQTTLSSSNPDFEEIEDASSQFEVDTNSESNVSLSARLQSWLKNPQNPASNLSTTNKSEPPYAIGQDVFLDANRTAATSVSTLAQQEAKSIHASDLDNTGQVIPTVQHNSSSSRARYDTRAIPLWSGITDERRPLSSTIPSTSDQSSLKSPSTSQARLVIGGPATHIVRPGQLSTSYTPLEALRTIFLGHPQSDDIQLYQQLGREDPNGPNGDRTYQNITAQGSSNNIFGDQITHVHHKQSTAVTAAVATSSASGGFFGGIFAAKALSRDHTSNPSDTTTPLPPPKPVQSASPENSIVTSASNLLTRMMHGPSPPPDPGPVKIGELTKDCLQALLGGKDRLEPAPALPAKRQKQNSAVTQEMLTRMVAQTVLTAAIPRVTINL